jgi:hypothetical protein
VLQERARESQKGTGGRSPADGVPIYIEGLSDAMAALERELSASALQYGRQLIRPVIDAMGYDVSGVLPS